VLGLCSSFGLSDRQLDQHMTEPAQVRPVTAHTACADPLFSSRFGLSLSFRHCWYLLSNLVLIDATDPAPVSYGQRDRVGSGRADRLKRSRRRMWRRNGFDVFSKRC
jgi:hypothetical protein